MRALFYILCLAIFIIICIWIFGPREKPEFIGLRPLTEHWAQVEADNTLQYDAKAHDTNESPPVEEHDTNQSPHSDTQNVEPETCTSIPELQPRITYIRHYLGSTEYLLSRREQLQIKDTRPEYICRVTLETIFQRPFNKAHPDFIRSTLTNRNLELDGYNVDLSLAFEYNGYQHYVFPNRYHNTYAEFLRQLQNDKYKREICPRLGITLLIIPYTIPNDDIPEYIAALLPPEYDPYRIDFTPPKQ